MNIAERIKWYYDTYDFKENYASCLFESYHNDKDIIIQRIYDLFNGDNYETEKYLINYFAIDKDQALKIYDFISENFEAFTKDMVNYYVGYCALDSISFGEQEEQMSGIYNHKTGKNYTLKYCQLVFNAAGFYIRGEYAYYDLSSDGLQINLLKGSDLLNQFLLTIK